MAEEKQELQSPKNQPFYRNLALIMNIYGLGKREWWGYEPANKIMLFHRKFIIFIAPICIVSELMYIALYYRKVPSRTLRTFFIMFPVNCITNICIRSAQTKSFKKIMKLFMDKIHLINYCDDDELVKKKVKKAEYYTRFSGYFLCLCLLTAWVLWYSAQIRLLYKNVDEIKNQTVTLETVMHLWMPFDYFYNIRNWAVVHAINAYLGLIACFGIFTYNTLNYIFIFHLIGHVQILKHKCRTEFFKNLDDRDMSKKLKEVIKHHTFIIGVFRCTQKAFGVNVTANYCHNLLSDSLLMYEILLGNKKYSALYVILLLVFLGGLILTSLVMEEIRRESDDLADAIYALPWENMSISNQKTVMMILARVQPPLEFISAGGLRAGVRPAISIMQSTFSYYVMLKSTINVE
ncbi:uncharacterized protein [Battus philenor]|uniref:uncharacterized protein n=1 Tax=Battus philenor TaxID=42288 RepID=UPI0035CF4EBC